QRARPSGPATTPAGRVLAVGIRLATLRRRSPPLRKGSGRYCTNDLVTIMHLASTGFIVALLAALTASPAGAFTDAELIDGFQRTVFGSEYQSFGWQSHLVKKYVDPIRLYVEDRSSTPRRATIENFVRTLPGLIAGLDVDIAETPDKANFHVFVVDRADYPAVVAKEIYSRPS